MSSESFSRPGAVDLSQLAQPEQPQPGSPGGVGASDGTAGGEPGSAASGLYTIDVTDATFQREVGERSLSVPVVIDFWATWCEPCKQLGPILEGLADEYAGRFVLAKVDVDANPQIAAATGIQSIPLVAAVLRGQFVPLFQGAQPAAQVRAALDQLLQAAVANGISGRSNPVSAGRAESAAAEPEPPDPRYAQAEAAVQRGDLDAAVEAYQSLVDKQPGDAEAARGLALVSLLRRTREIDVNEARATAAAKPDDAQAQCTVADLDLAGGHVTDAFDRLLNTVRRTAGDERDLARRHLLELFEVVGTEDERVRTARQALGAALF